MSQNLPLRISGGRGGLVVIALVVIIAALVIIGLILPPVALPSRLGLGSGGCKTLTAKNPSLDHPDGLTVALDPTAKVTLAIKLASIPEAKVETASADLKAALKALPRGYRAKGPLFQINACGTRAVPTTLTVSIPDGAEPWETLDLLAWDGKAWQWVGGHLDADNGVLVTSVKQVPQNVIVAQTTITSAVVASDLPASGNVADEGAPLATILFVPGLLPADDGGINGDPEALPHPPEGVTAALYPSLRNWTKPGRANPGLVSDMIADAKLRATHVKAVTGLVVKSRYAGVQIDYRGLGKEDRAAFSDLITQLGDSLHKVNKKLVVVVPAPQPNDDGTWDPQGYDWHTIGAAADVVQMDLPTDPAAYGKSSAEALVRWAVGETSRYKLYLGLTSLSVDQAGTDVIYLPLDQALKPFGNVKGQDGAITPGTAVSVTLSGSAQDVTFDPATKAYRITYTANNQAHTVVLGSGNSLAPKLAWALRYRLHGVTIRGLLDAGNDPAVFDAVQQYAAQTPPPDIEAIKVTWTVQGTPAATSPLTRTELVWTAPNAPGTFSIAAAIAGISRGQATLTVGASVATPTPTIATTPATTSTVAGGTDCQPTAKYIADVTVPDNSKLDKGAAFIKTWRVKNSGTCDWPADTVLAFASGNKLGAPDTVPVGVVKAGETKDISVNMTAPNQDAANVTGKWQVKSGGKAFGDALTVLIISGNPATATPPPATAQPQQPPTGPVAPPSSGPTLYGVQAHWAALWNQEDKMAETAARITDLGMDWTKLQVRWGSEDYFYDCSGNYSFDWNHTNEVLNSRNPRLRVLFTVVTSPPCTHPGTGDIEAAPDDVNQFANFVGEMASRYKGLGIAIEIWERPNATPNLSAVKYTQMLAASYNKIKAIDPGIIVIGGAPAPYVSGGDVEPFTYLRQMKAAGADKYMDCIGVYYNDSIAAPDTNLKGFVQGYQATMGKQACITSFGVASEQNVGHIAGIDYFKDNTEANQADWTTQAMGLARQWGARMIMLFNLDYGALASGSPNGLFSFLNPLTFKRPVYGAVKNWCATNGCK
jgi:hypothetical protein